MARKAWVPTSQVLVLVQMGIDIDALWLEKNCIQSYPTTPIPKRASSSTGQYGVDLCLERSVDGQKGGGAHFKSTGACSDR